MYNSVASWLVYCTALVVLFVAMCIADAGTAAAILLCLLQAAVFYPLASVRHASHCSVCFQESIFVVDTYMYALSKLQPAVFPPPHRRSTL